MIHDKNAYMKYDEMMEGACSCNLSDWLNYGRVQNQKMINAAIWLVQHYSSDIFDNVEARNLFYKMKIKYKIWKQGGVGDRHAYKMFVETTYALADLNVPNPFTRED